MSIFLFKRRLRRSLPASGANVSEVLRTDEKIFERSPTIFLARTEGNEILTAFDLNSSMRAATI